MGAGAVGGRGGGVEAHDAEGLVFSLYSMALSATMQVLASLLRSACCICTCARRIPTRPSHRRVPAVPQQSVMQANVLRRHNQHAKL